MEAVEEGEKDAIVIAHSERTLGSGRFTGEHPNGTSRTHYFICALTRVRPTKRMHVYRLGRQPTSWSFE